MPNKSSRMPEDQDPAWEPQPLLEDLKTYEKVTPPFSRSFFGQTLCAGVAGICQMYAGGIVLDTVSTRLQAGFGMGQCESCSCRERQQELTCRRLSTTTFPQISLPIFLPSHQRCHARILAAI